MQNIQGLQIFPGGQLSLCDQELPAEIAPVEVIPHVLEVRVQVDKVDDDADDDPGQRDHHHGQRLLRQPQELVVVHRGRRVLVAGRRVLGEPPRVELGNVGRVLVVDVDGVLLDGLSPVLAVLDPDGVAGDDGGEQEEHDEESGKCSGFFAQSPG